MEAEDDDCPFCRIAADDSDTEILLSDEQLLCFRDIKPGAPHHYLIIPRMHIDNCKDLNQDHVPLVEQMVQMGRTILAKNRVSDLDDICLGFHIRPFASVPHLHLHALAPASNRSLKSQLRYGPQAYWFIAADKVLSQLKTQGKVK